MSSTGARSRLKPKSRSNSPVNRAVPLDQAQVSLLAQLLRAGRLGAAFLQARDPPTFLVDSDNGLMPHLGPQIIEQAPQQRRCSNVSPKKNETGWLHVANNPRSVRVQLHAGNSHNDVTPALHPRD